MTSTVHSACSNGLAVTSSSAPASPDEQGNPVTRDARPGDLEPIVETLVAEWAAISDLLDILADPEWSMATALPGWSVHDVVAHLIGTESVLAGEPVPEVPVETAQLFHVRNEIGASNERWAYALRDDPPAQLRARFRDITDRRSRALRAMQPADFDAPTATPVGTATYRRFMEIRVFDCWMHEQDIRDATGHPGHQNGSCAGVHRRDCPGPWVFGRQTRWRPGRLDGHDRTHRPHIPDTARRGRRTRPRRRHARGSCDRRRAPIVRPVRPTCRWQNGPSGIPRRHSSRRRPGTRTTPRHQPRLHDLNLDRPASDLVATETRRLRPSRHGPPSQVSDTSATHKSPAPRRCRNLKSTAAG